MDDTIENLIGTWVEYLNERFATSVSHEDNTEWDITKAFPTLTKEEVFSPIFENDFWKRVPPIDGAADALQKLIEEGPRLTLPTAKAGGFLVRRPQPAPARSYTVSPSV